ncbi:hypothetical protein M0Q97_05490 [Candidatus Dojkabacteria bacterium]|jgi:hypothetical protein|nr:hypothetical protein [Candidatus Dojkabacteria bacterium]
MKQKNKDKIKELQNRIDKMYDELFQQNSKKSYLFDAHFELINDIETGVNEKILEYKDKEFDDMPVEDFLSTLQSIKRYITEYKKSYKL